jgi:hypothetical protein
LTWVHALVQSACRWSEALSAASEGSPLIILKVIALLQAAAAQAADLQAAAAAAAASTQTSAASEVDAAASQQLLPHLEPCLGLLASTIASGVGVVLRSQASLALQQLLRAPGQGVCYCCLQELLGGNSSSSRRVHPEVAALLMQEVRLQLSRTEGGQLHSVVCQAYQLSKQRCLAEQAHSHVALLARIACALCLLALLARFACSHCLRGITDVAVPLHLKVEGTRPSLPLLVVTLVPAV